MATCFQWLVLLATCGFLRIVSAQGENYSMVTSVREGLCSRFERSIADW